MRMERTVSGGGLTGSMGGNFLMRLVLICHQDDSRVLPIPGLPEAAPGAEDTDSRSRIIV